MAMKERKSGFLYESRSRSKEKDRRPE